MSLVLADPIAGVEIPLVLAEMEMTREQVTLLREIGHGEFGVVLEAVASALPLSGQHAVKVAVKMMKDKSQLSKQSFVSEAERLKPLKHENVCALLGVVFRSEPFLIVLEFMANGDLKSYMRAVADEGGVLTLGMKMRLCMDVGRGFVYLQESRYIHRDLAARNVLLNESFTAKICDFGEMCLVTIACVECIAGMARKVFSKEYYSASESSSQSGWVLPIRWMAPESFSDGTWDLKTDVWMFGVVLWGMHGLALLFAC